MKLLFIGPPGAGKGTQAHSVASQLAIAHISTGDLFRQHVQAETDLGKQVQSIMAAGDYVPDQITVEMIKGRMLDDDAQAGFILDGFPRTAGQVDALDELLGGEPLDLVVAVEVPQEELRRRMLTRGRSDDNEETVRHRIDIYTEQTQPLITEFSRRGLVSYIDGVGEVSEITARILTAISAVSGE